MKKPLSLKTQTMLLTSAIVLGALLFFGVFNAIHQASLTREHLEDKVRISASHLRDNPLVIQALESGHTNDELIEMVETIRTENNLRYIVIMDMDLIRFTHPVSDRIGGTFVGDDMDPVFEGISYTSQSIGSLGPSVRAFEPVLNREDTQIGAVSVGISTEAIEDATSQAQTISAWWAVGSLALGLIGAYLLAGRIKSTLRGLEPGEIARIVQEREAMLEAVSEGIVAINENGQLIAVNNAAKQFLIDAGHTGPIEGENAASVWPELHLHHVVATPKSHYDEVVKRGHLEAVATSVPIFIEGNCIGALATFKEKSQLDDIVKRMNGMETYAQSLRSETHEFMNKLHIISAMVETDSYDELSDYIETLSLRYQAKKESQLPQDINRLVEDASLAQFLASKTVHMETEGVHVIFQSGTPWPKMPAALIDAWTTIIGNTLNNSLEALQNQQEKRVLITMKHVGGVLRYVLEDNGPGFSQHQIGSKFPTTKEGDHGYGLSNAREKTEQFNGTFHILSKEGEGTIVTVHMPYQKKGDDEYDSSRND